MKSTGLNERFIRELKEWSTSVGSGLSPALDTAEYATLMECQYPYLCTIIQIVLMNLYRFKLMDTRDIYIMIKF